MYEILWEKKAFKQLMGIELTQRRTITHAAARLHNWPACAGVKRLAGHQYAYRLRVGRYRVFFDVDSAVRIIRIEEVKKRDEHTY
ncbi:MAG: type II toxin-antitoxin system RelE/ParE family toxin [Deltaproteobacteria bacterium]|nr:type II toxin-antitoxin system RelE/ParE family toxin [Deltaproteobacteria bacterium]